MSLACTGIGIGSARSIALGDAYVLSRGPVEISPHWIDEDKVEDEIERLRQAIETARHELRAVREQIPAETPEDIAEFIDAHLLMLSDVTITEAPQDLIRNQLCRAEWALQIRRDALVEVFDAMDDTYLRTRREDVEHVINQIQKILVEGRGPEPPVHENMDGRVIIAQDLTPADIILMRHRGVSAFVTEFGGPMSHTAILARSLGIPAVLGARNVTQYLKHGELLVVDGSKGVVLAEPDDRVLAHYCQLLEDNQAHREALRGLVRQPSASADGETVHLLANIELPEDIAHARAAGATGIGLYRTEFLYMNRSATPDEEEQLAAYLEVVRGVDGIPVTIRTLDLGADKQMGGRSQLNCPPVCNPALGLRAIRLCLKEPELFVPQIRAILRAAAEGPVRMMLPMLSNLQEVMSARRLIEEAKRSLRRDGLAFDDEIPIGGMIEVPAAALSADSFAQHLDFLSLGTNDLIQYTLAIDRVDDEVNYLYDPLHPAVLNLIRMTIDAGHRHNIPVSMCGEMAGDPNYTRLLLGLGLRRFSMQPNSILEVKDIVRNSRTLDLRQRVAALLTHQTDRDNESLLAELNQI